MCPEPACDWLPEVGSAGPFLFLDPKHGRGERAEVTVTEGHGKGDASSAGPPFAQAHAGDDSFPRAPWNSEIAPLRDLTLSPPKVCPSFSVSLGQRCVLPTMLRRGKFGRFYLDCLRQRWRAARGHSQHRASTTTTPGGLRVGLLDGAQK